MNRNITLISIDQRTPKYSHAGSKAREDATIILDELGATAKTMECSCTEAFADIVHDLFAMNYELMKIAKECRSGDIAVLQFPYRCFLTFRVISLLTNSMTVALNLFCSFTTSIRFEGQAHLKEWVSFPYPNRCTAISLF